MKKFLMAFTLVSSTLTLSACNLIENAVLEGHAETEIHQGDWQAEIHAIAEKAMPPMVALSELKDFMVTYEPVEGEIEQFQQEILADFQAGEYLLAPGNAEYVLTQFFKARMVNAYSDNEMWLFSFHYMQLMKDLYKDADKTLVEVLPNKGPEMYEILYTLTNT